MPIKRERGHGSTYCYGCLCDTCANSVELPPWRSTPGECAAPCFTCDECRRYDGDFGKRSMWTDTCPRYIEAKKAAEARELEEKKRQDAENRRAEAARGTFKVIRGGKA